MWMFLREMCPKAEVRELVVPARPGYSAFNPSIARGPTGLKCIVRSSDYRMNPLGRYLMKDQAIRTKNHLCTLDSSFTVVDMVELDDSELDIRVEYPYVLGMEDARLYWKPEDDAWYAYGTVRYHRPDGHCQIAQDRLNGFILRDREIYEGFQEHEKNWAKAPYGTGFVHSWNNRPDWRGSSQMIQVGYSFVTTIHEVHYETGRRIYSTRLVKVDTGTRTSATEPFYFIRPGIEFAAGIALCDDRLAVSFGYYDERALLALIPWDEIRWEDQPDDVFPLFITPWCR